MERLLTVEQVCDLFAFKQSYLYHLTHTRQIPFIKIGNHPRFRQSELESWLVSMTSSPAGRSLVLADERTVYHASQKA